MRQGRWHATALRRPPHMSISRRIEIKPSSRPSVRRSTIAAIVPPQLKEKPMLRLLCVLLLAFPLFAQEPPAVDPDAPVDPNAPHTMVIEVGSRAIERSRTDTPVPVDVLPVAEIAAASGQLDLGELLQLTEQS